MKKPLANHQLGLMTPIIFAAIAVSIVVAAWQSDAV
jgi:hypothetical protein